MPRLNLQMPTNIIYQTQLRVAIEHINYSQHLGHDSLIKLLHEARVQFFLAFGMQELNVDGKITMLVTLEVEYKQQAFYGDELSFAMALGQHDQKSCELYYQVMRLKDDKLIALARTGMIFYDPAEQKVAPIPLSLQRLF